MSARCGGCRRRGRGRRGRGCLPGRGDRTGTRRGPGHRRFERLLRHVAADRHHRGQRHRPERPEPAAHPGKTRNRQRLTAPIFLYGCTGSVHVRARRGVGVIAAAANPASPSIRTDEQGMVTVPAATPSSVGRLPRTRACTAVSVPCDETRLPWVPISMTIDVPVWGPLWQNRSARFFFLGARLEAEFTARRGDKPLRGRIRVEANTEKTGQVAAVKPPNAEELKARQRTIREERALLPNLEGD